MKNLSKRDLKLLLILGAVLLFIIVYMAAYLPLSDKADAAEQEAAALRPQLTELQGYYANLDNYNQGIDDASDTIKSTLKKYPTDVRTEDLVEYATGLERKLKIDLTAIDFTEPTLQKQFTTLRREADQSISATDRSAYSIGEILSCDLSYQEMKDLADAIAKSDDRSSLETMEISYNAETGQLTGSVSLNKYFITDDFTYHATQTPSVELGREDLFGTVTPSASSSSQAG